MRSVRQEALSVATVMAVPAALLSVFPFGVFSFKALSPQTVSKPSAAFVRLTAEEESDALRAAKTSWQADGAAGRDMWTYLPLGELPEDTRNGPILGDGVWIGRQTAAAPVEYGTPAWRPSQAADAPEKIPVIEESPRPPVFSKEELLKIGETP